MADKDPIKVGVLFSSTGTTSAVERSQLAGTMFAIEQVNDAGGIDGRELQPVYCDPKCSLIEYRNLAEWLVHNEKINVIFGCYMSSTRKAVIPVVEKWQRLLMYPTLYEGFEFSRNVIYTGAAPNQNSALLAEFMMRNFGARVYMIGSDYIYPYESNRIMNDFISEYPGGVKLEERYVSLDATESDFEEIVKDIRAKEPDFVFSTVVGSGTRLLYQAYAQAGLDPNRTPIASLTTAEAEISEMGKGVATGHFTAAPYFQSLNNLVNRDVLNRFYRRYGKEVEPNMCWEAAYFQVHLFAKAMLASGSDGIDQLLPHLLGCEFNAPQGCVRIDPTNHHTRLYPRIGRVDEAGKFQIVYEMGCGVDADPYLVNHAIDGCGGPSMMLGERVG